MRTLQLLYCSISILVSYAPPQHGRLGHVYVVVRQHNTIQVLYSTVQTLLPVSFLPLKREQHDECNENPESAISLNTCSIKDLVREEKTEAITLYEISLRIIAWHLPYKHIELFICILDV